MRSKTVTHELAKLPAGLLAKLRADAEQEADDLAEFLRHSAVWYAEKFPNRLPVKLPREALLGLSIVMRLRRWEQNSIYLRREAGMPSADEALKFVTSVMSGPKLVKFVARHSATMRRLLWDSILWSLDEFDLGMDLAIVGCEDEQFLDAIAQFVVDQAIKKRSHREEATATGAEPHDPSLATALAH